MKSDKVKKAAKKIILILLASTIACNAYNKHKIATANPQINDKYNGNNYFASYSEGKVYICTANNKDYIRSICNENDVVVIDKRDAEDPDMVILKSYSISDVFTMHEVLNIIMEYERVSPSEWDRTYNSLRNEWICHNLSYLCNYETQRTADADLNNADEELYKKMDFVKILKAQGDYVDQ